MIEDVAAADVVAFWRDAGPAKWFRGGDAFDAACRERLGAAHHAAARRELDGWASTAEGALALLLLLDQIPRNIFRGSGHAFATDGLARHFARLALDAGHDAAFEPALRAFFYLPLEHSEDMADQDRSVALFAALGDANYDGYATAHRDVVARFGRFPHRNAILGRASTPEEEEFLKQPGSSF
jgi:uncharacterized protein (DUF924 family)